jgi:predicted nucleotidyltransferase
MDFGLHSDMIQAIIETISKNESIQKVVIYGSRAKGNYKPGSDIDIALYADALTLNEVNGIGIALDDLMLPYIFDLCVYNKINNKDLQKHIDRVGKIIFERNGELMS